MTVQPESFATAVLNVHGCYPRSSSRPFGPQALAVVHSDWVVTNFGRRHCLLVVKIIMLLFGAVIGTSVVAVVGDYFARVVFPLHPPLRSAC